MDYDIAVIGGGPAGVSAAITAASKGRKVRKFDSCKSKKTLKAA